MLQASITSLLTPSQKASNSRASYYAQPSSSKSTHTRKRSEADDSFRGSTPSKKPRVTMSARLHSAAPLAERLRPQTIGEFVGQPHLTESGSLLLSHLESGATGSIVFWGPPGCGKTTLARLLAKRTDAEFKELSATDSGIAEVRAVVEEAKRLLALTGRRTILFLDEVHRFNKAQQDIFLPFLEQGHLQLIGATTENPSFRLTSALLSRCRCVRLLHDMAPQVFILERLSDDDIRKIVTNAIERVTDSILAKQDLPPSSPVEIEILDDDEATNVASSQPDVEEPLAQALSSTQASEVSESRSETQYTDALCFPNYPHITSKVLSTIIALSTGDARTALSLIELVLHAPITSEEPKLLAALRRSVATAYDRGGDSHYDMISALHKSVRGSQPSAALYWLARMLTAGEDPLYVARRMVVCASEDIGMADRHALPLAMAAYQACQVIGMPECRINLAHLVTYLAEAPKSTRAYEGYARAEEAAAADPSIPVPLMMRNAPTGLMKQLGYAGGYRYNPDYRHPVTNDYMPIQFRGDEFVRKAGDLGGKTWDEDALRKWEYAENGGKPWSGRPSENGEPSSHDERDSET
ncbi:P-loop containing nucleoside triphosphate hydrolase protein [Epithele typhae]|uniref:P-loop containing nucleoside triphosphate hydrolase protein n=1 Tax=Epithele typhae TaxID=378194 RepID=UPI0020073FF8|nr:P-loop containing nucleoside triphosphate hydrolase protein [Epithele typhae]KAH9929539.1 P-loop containing nucleoside triphosphate hydrolase protein [Epithele typhae]